MVNVNRGIDDQFYRYKMPLIQAKVQGHGNGIHTAVPNMDMVARSLDRPPSYVTKYFGVELGSVTQIVDKDNKYIVNGRHDAETMQDLLDGFIKKFVLCKECGNPETKLRVTSKKAIEQNCIACGYRCSLPQVHKLCKYIHNNPPNDVKSKKGKEKKSKEERRAAKNEKSGKGAKEKGPKGGDGGDSPPKESSSIDQQAGCSRDNIAMRSEGGALDVPAAVGDDGDDDDDWDPEDLDEEAVRARADVEVGAGAKGLVGSSDLDKSMNDRLELFVQYVEDRKDLPKLPSKEIIGEAERLDCKDKGVTVLVQCLWAVDDPLVAMKKYQGIFQRFVFENPKAQKYTLQAFEKLMEMKPDLMPKVMHLMKQMYDLDLVEEEAFLEWEKKANKAKSGSVAHQMKSKASAFLKWIKEADEEESSDDENIGFESAAPAPTPAQKVEEKKAEAAKAAEAAKEEEDDDLDIDDI